MIFHQWSNDYPTNCKTLHHCKDYPVIQRFSNAYPMVMLRKPELDWKWLSSPQLQTLLLSSADIANVSRRALGAFVRLPRGSGGGDAEVLPMESMDDRFKLTRISLAKTWNPETSCREPIFRHCRVHVEEKILCDIVCWCWLSCWFFWWVMMAIDGWWWYVWWDLMISISPVDLAT